MFHFLAVSVCISVRNSFVGLTACYIASIAFFQMCTLLPLFVGAGVATLHCGDRSANPWQIYGVNHARINVVRAVCICVPG